MSTKKTNKETKTIFVIMPFKSTPSRHKSQLTSFFNDVLKKSIEGGRFNYKYIVNRSDDTFNITEQIIKDTYYADIVICDLSGKESNPNVMYELGLRLALTNKPVILIREANADNKTIFDISGFYAHPYDPLDYAPLITHIKTKIKKFESGKESYQSPVLKIVEQEIPLLQKMAYQRARELLVSMAAAVYTMRGLFLECLIVYLRKSNQEFDFGKKYDELTTIIQDNKKEFLALDLSNFHFTFSSQPTVDAYLADQYLNNILHYEIVGEFTLFVITYHAHYLGSDVFHHRWTSGAIHSYFGETEIFLSMIECVRQALLVDSKKEIESIAEEVKRLHKNSHLT